jgi:hypothetical protein
MSFEFSKQVRVNVNFGAQYYSGGEPNGLFATAGADVSWNFVPQWSVISEVFALIGPWQGEGHRASRAPVRSGRRLPNRVAAFAAHNSVPRCAWNPGASSGVFLVTKGPARQPVREIVGCFARKPSTNGLPRIGSASPDERSHDPSQHSRSRSLCRAPLRSRTGSRYGLHYFRSSVHNPVETRACRQASVRDGSWAYHQPG